MAPLSWEKPLLQDSRLDMDPLGWDRTEIFFRKAAIIWITNTSDRRSTYTLQRSQKYFTFCPIISNFVSENLRVLLCHDERLICHRHLFLLVAGIVPCLLQLFWEWDTAGASVGLHSLPLSSKENQRALQTQQSSVKAAATANPRAPAC